VNSIFDSAQVLYAQSRGGTASEQCDGPGNSVVAQSAARRGEQRGGPRHSMARRPKGQRGATAKGAARAAAGHGTGKG
jgi:hypothetical protein